MTVRVVAQDGTEIQEPFLLRLAGWAEERYFDEAPEDQLWEFQEGELIVHSPATPRHQRLVGFLTFLLRGYVEQRNLGEVFNGPAVLRLRAGVVREPDIFFLNQGRLGAVRQSWIEGPADLVVEVMSPSTRSYDLMEKAQSYLETGVTEYWVVDPERRQVHVHRREDHDGLRWEVQVPSAGKLTATAVPGFWLEVEWLWQEPLPGGLSKLHQILAS